MPQKPISNAVAMGADCQQLWAATRSLAAPQYWSKPSLIWFQKPRALTSFVMEKKEQTDSSHEKMLSFTSPTSQEHASRPFLPASEHAGYLLTAQGHRTARAGRDLGRPFMGKGAQRNLSHTVQKHLETFQ